MMSLIRAGTRLSKFVLGNKRSTINALMLMQYSKGVQGSKFTLDTSRGIVIVDGISFLLDSMEPGIIFETFWLRMHDKIRVKPGDTVLDAGACFGDTALYFASLGCKVYAVEPNPINYKTLERNLELNPKLKQQISTIEAAVGEDGYVSFVASGSTVEGGGSAFLKRRGASTCVKSYSIASVLSKFHVQSVDHLKMDCKGAETKLHLDDLRRVKKSVKIEYSLGTPEDYNRLMDLLKAAGFTSEVYRPTAKDSTLPVWRGGMIYGVRKH